MTLYEFDFKTLVLKPVQIDRRQAMVDINGSQERKSNIQSECSLYSGTEYEKCREKSNKILEKTPTHKK